MTAAGMALPFSGTFLSASSARGSYHAPQDSRTLCVFSKHLQFVDYEPMAEAAAEAGFGGVDSLRRRNAVALRRRLISRRRASSIPKTREIGSAPGTSPRSSAAILPGIPNPCGGRRNRARRFRFGRRTLPTRVSHWPLPPRASECRLSLPERIRVRGSADDLGS